MRKYKRPFESLYNVLVASAKLRNFTYMSYQAFLILTYAEYCSYCGKRLVWDPQSNRYNLDRIDNRLGYERSNVVPCCSTCNRMKSNFDYDTFIEHCSNIHERHGKGGYR